jgi:hypothetical protein
MKYKVKVEKTLSYVFRNVEADSIQTAQELVESWDMDEADHKDEWQSYPEAELENDQEDH